MICARGEAMNRLTRSAFILGAVWLMTYARAGRVELQGVGQLRVVVEDLRPEVEAMIARETIKSAVELRLRQTGISLADDDSRPSDYLYINLAAIEPTGTALWAFSLRVAFFECGVTHTRDGTACAGVWETSDMATAGRADFIESVRTAVLEVVDSFLRGRFGERIAVRSRARAPAQPELE